MSLLKAACAEVRVYTERSSVVFKLMLPASTKHLLALLKTVETYHKRPGVTSQSGSRGYEAMCSLKLRALAEDVGAEVFLQQTTYELDWVLAFFTALWDVYDLEADFREPVFKVLRWSWRELFWACNNFTIFSVIDRLSTFSPAMDSAAARCMLKLFTVWRSAYTEVCNGLITSWFNADMSFQSEAH